MFVRALQLSFKSWFGLDGLSCDLRIPTVSRDLTFVSSCCFCRMKGKLFEGSTRRGTIGGAFPPISILLGDETSCLGPGEGLIWAGRGSIASLSGDSSGVGDYWFR